VTSSADYTTPPFQAPYQHAAWLARPAYSRDISSMTTVLDLELARLRAMTPAEKLRVSAGLWRDARALSQAAITRRHPEWTVEQVETETRRVMSGDRA